MVPCTDWDTRVWTALGQALRVTVTALASLAGSVGHSYTAYFECKLEYR